MSNVENAGEWSGDAYAQALTGEGEYWDNFIARRLLSGEMPGSVDWRLNFTQFRFNHDWGPLCLGPHGINFRMREINYLLRAAVPRPGVRVLDLGCGAGWLSLELARLGAIVTALDISPANLALARYMAATNARNFPYLYKRFAGLFSKLEDFGSVEYSYADLNSVELPRGEYDAVVVWDSLHHVANLERLLEQVRSSLKPGGSFVGVDHAFVTPLTHNFNVSTWGQVEDFYGWVTQSDPHWLYDGVNALAASRDWGVLSVDYDSTPVPGFERFQRDLFSEMLGVLHGKGRQQTPDPTQAGPSQKSSDAESPFEDVSAQRLMRVLYESFAVKEFRTICPFIQPETHFPHYRSEDERVFQHYLSVAMIKEGERAIEAGRADGQWFLFHLAPERPATVTLPGWLREFGASGPAERIAHLNEDAARKNDYIARLEADVANKNAAITDLETKVKQHEAALAEARRPRLPWKR
jgi:2-polyprenyl-3-methyl-5-hydroxy-6-metoxy-1,4-benzoquinol methylase